MATITSSRPDTPAAVLACAEGLAPSIAQRAPDVESAGRIPHDLLAELVEAGCFRVLLPESHGGAGATPAEAMHVFETLSRADASVGWTVMIGSGAWLDLAGLPRETFDALYAGGADVLIAGVFNPSGTAVGVDAGYRVSGRWAFASGSPHAEWFYGNCVEQVGDAVQLRIALLARDQIEVEDTWHVLGMRGTASHHVRVDNELVPAERTALVFECEPTLETPIVHIPVPSLFAMAIAATALGIARGALDDVAVMATTRVPLLAGGPLSANPGFQRDLAVAESDLSAARSLLFDAADEAWTTASERGEVKLEQRARWRSAACWAVARATGIVTTAYRAGGGRALYLDNPLQRRLRDVQTVAQHFLVRPDTFTTAGAVMAGQQIDVPVF